MDLTDIVDLADMGPRIIVVVAIFAAFNVLAYALCLITDSDGICVLAFVICNIGAVVAVRGVL